jgi:hypothetical protein
MAHTDFSVPTGIYLLDGMPTRLSPAAFSNLHLILLFLKPLCPKLNLKIYSLTLFNYEIN